MKQSLWHTYKAVCFPKLSPFIYVLVVKCFINFSFSIHKSAIFYFKIAENNPQSLNWLLSYKYFFNVTDAAKLFLCFLQSQMTSESEHKCSFSGCLDDSFVNLFIYLHNSDSDKKQGNLAHFIKFLTSCFQFELEDFFIGVFLIAQLIS